MAETFDLPNEEVFAAGTWNGDTYDLDDLDKMVEAYKATSAAYQPKLKLTHDHPKGWPAVGYMENLRRVGDKLVADFRGIPGKLFESIKAGGYRSKSAEVLWNVVVNGKKFPYLMKAVALLGVEMPAVQSIGDLMSSLYSSDGGEARAYTSEAPQGDARTYDMKKQEDQHMDAKIEQLTQDLATANAKLAQANELVEARGKEVKSYADKTAALETQVKDLTARAEKSEGQVREYQEKEVTAKVTGTIDKLITEKKLAPAMKEKAYTLLRAVVDSGTEKKYKLGKDGKEQTLEDLAVELLGSSGVPLNTYARTGAGERQEGVQDGEGDINTDLAEKAKKYQETHKGVSYGDALKAVAREEGVDPSLRK
jgi:hypothetical protein